MSSFVSLSCTDSNGNAVSGGLAATEAETYFVPAANNYIWTMRMKDTSADYIGAARIIARIMTDDGIFERVFTFNTFDQKAYPALTFMDGFASYALPSGSSFSEATGYGQFYTILTKTLASGARQSVLLLNSSAVGNDVYVNVNGVKTKLDYSIDTSYFTNIDALHSSMLAAYLRIDYVSTDYTVANIVQLKQKIDLYSGISIGEWVYMQHSYSADINSMNSITSALRQRLKELGGL